MIKPKLILLVGIPGSGKSTYAEQYIKENNNTIHLSSDAIRAELWGDESIQGNPGEVFSLMQKRAVEALNDGKNVVYDATNITRKDRAGIISACPKFTTIECHIIWAPIEECINRDAVRDRTVGNEVIDRMLKRFQAPWVDEGIEDIFVIRPNSFDFDKYTSDCWDAMKIPHDNPHHTLDVNKHCEEALKFLDSPSVDFNLKYAALWHDIGKPKTKVFVNIKGETCETAHFYSHNNLGAWMSYGLQFGTPYIAWLISTHMDPFFDSKYYRNLPSYLKRDIDILHKADLEAH
jgi:putative nucleotidyltransferase with HDIG domain